MLQEVAEEQSYPRRQLEGGNIRGVGEEAGGLGSAAVIFPKNL